MENELFNQKTKSPLNDNKIKCIIQNAKFPPKNIDKQTNEIFTD